MAALLLVAVGIYTRDPKRGSRGSRIVPWRDDEMAAFVREVSPLGVSIPDALAVYTAESGLDPHASSGVAWGLCQATARTLRALGWAGSPADFARLDVARQAPWIASLIAMQIRAIGYVPATAAELYRANFSPMAAKARADVIYRSPSDAYAANRALDRHKRGYISQSDLEESIAIARNHPAYVHAVAQYQRIAGAKS